MNVARTIHAETRVSLLDPAEKEFESAKERSLCNGNCALEWRGSG